MSQFTPALQIVQVKNGYKVNAHFPKGDEEGQDGLLGAISTVHSHELVYYTIDEAVDFVRRYFDKAHRESMT